MPRPVPHTKPPTPAQSNQAAVAIAAPAARSVSSRLVLPGTRTRTDPHSPPTPPAASSIPAPSGTPVGRPAASGSGGVQGSHSMVHDTSANHSAVAAPQRSARRGCREHPKRGVRLFADGPHGTNGTARSVAGVERKVGMGEGAAWARFEVNGGVPCGRIGGDGMGARASRREEWRVGGFAKSLCGMPDEGGGSCG
ncbi:hypothetical protein BU16DRAFT_107958 [Lophium mytilinum]|uniref:Uncharacterized protein n=1 Tax=Lophium mytilinum TaxID=390894 RepID=A0A6A6QJP8_9PEZI|nr:hypothetical protein BU16DRAFT_107958 [Lophium mytilinum]